MKDHKLIFFALAILVLALASVLFMPNNGFRTSRQAIDPSEITSELGFAYTYKTMAQRFRCGCVLGDTNENPVGSTMRLYENGVELKKSHTQHADIREIGRGAFSHWGSDLYFSTSDNTDPRVNGRRYEIDVDSDYAAYTRKIAFVALIIFLDVLLLMVWELMKRSERRQARA